MLTIAGREVQSKERGMQLTIPDFIFAALAATRLTQLLAQEDGPANLLRRCREQPWSGVLRCVMCSSMWASAGVILLALFGGEWGKIVLYVLALSALAILMVRLADWLDAMKER